jgi:hypothetical protein
MKETPTLREALAAKVAEMRVEFQRLAVRGFMTVPSMQVSMWADDLDALLSAYPDNAGWRDIATAPEGCMMLMCSMTATAAREWAFVDWLAQGKLILHPYRSPTHWMPLPAPPE